MQSCDNINRHLSSGGLLAVACVLLLGVLSPARVAAQRIDWGPFKLQVSYTAGVEYTGNIPDSRGTSESDVKLQLGPTVTGGIVLPFTLRGGEKLTLQTGVSYQYQISLENPEGKQTFSSPISASVVIPIEFEKWSIIAANNFTLRNDPLESTVALTQASAEEYSNDASINITRNFGRMAITLGGLRHDKFVPDVPTLEETRHEASLTTAFFFRPNYSIFWRNSLGIVEPEALTRQESTGWSTEIGLSGQLTPHLSGVISIGFAHSTLKEKSLGPGSGIFGGIFDPVVLRRDNVDGISSTLGLNYSHPLRPNTTYGFSFFRSPGVTAVLNDSNITEIMGATFVLAHRVNPRLTLVPTVTWTRATDVSATGSGEETDLISINFSVSRALTQQLTANFGYRYQIRMSNIEGGDYETGRITAAVNFSF